MSDRKIWVSTSGKDSNSGSASAPLKSIQAALNKASTGDDVMVKAGTYTGNLKVKDNGISLISADGNQDATIRAASQNGSTISGFGVEGVTIKGFVIDGANNSNAIHFGMSGKGFKDPIRNLTIQDNVIHSSGDDGVKVSQAYNVKVVHNSITNSGGEGIDFVAVNNSRIAGNNIKGVDGTAGIVVKGGSSNDTISNNKVWDANVNGISVGGWTNEKWMWPNARSYEAKNITVSGNEVWDVNKSAILVSGAHNSTITKNYLHPDNNYDAVIWLDSSYADHDSPIRSKNITLSGNVLDSNDWLRVNSGNKNGLLVSGNKVGEKHASGVLGVSASASDDGNVSGASGSAAETKITVLESVSQVGEPEDQQPTSSASAAHALTADITFEAGTAPETIAVSKENLPDAFDVEDEGNAGLLVSVGDEFIVYSPVRDEDVPTDGVGQAEATDAGDYLYFSVSGDTTASASLTKWQALEDASALAVTPTIPDQTHTVDATPDSGGWLL